MSDYIEIDFLDVECGKSGDAISMRYEVDGVTTIHLVDGGFQEFGTSLVEHIKTHYDAPSFIDHVVVTHPDGDHAGGLREVLESFQVGALWMLRPWIYAEYLLSQFPTYNSIDHLRARLRSAYPNLAALEDIAHKCNIPIFAPFQGEKIGAFTVMAPTPLRYFSLILASDKTPESKQLISLSELFSEAFTKVKNYIKANWGEERFSANETSAENEMSVVQYSNLSSARILLTGDVGRAGLTEAADYAPAIGLTLPGVDMFQVPHHGSRRNVSTEVLDRWLGFRLVEQRAEGSGLFHAYISSAKADKDHPRDSVIRAMIHRGADVYTTEEYSFRTFRGSAPPRPSWTGAISPTAYPTANEE